MIGVNSGRHNPSIERNDRVSHVFFWVACFAGEAQYNAITDIMTFGDIESLDYALINPPKCPHGITRSSDKH